jgi:hypothetical protein
LSVFALPVSLWVFLFLRSERVGVVEILLSYFEAI